MNADENLSGSGVSMLSEGHVLVVTILGVLTADRLAKIRAEATRRINEVRASACLVDLRGCVIEFAPALLADGFLHHHAGHLEDRPGALLVAQRHRCTFLAAARDAAASGVLIPVFTDRESACRFLEVHSRLWWIDRRYPGLPRCLPQEGIS